MALPLPLESGIEQVARAAELVARRADPVHLVGIGGIGMAGLAVHLAARGLRVSGCDRVAGRVTDDLGARGVPVQIGHDPAHVRDAAWCVRSTAVREADPEIRAARERGIPALLRGAVLPALLEGRRSVAVSGTHGKTTTAAMIAQVLEAAGRSPGFCIGGEIPALGGVAADGAGRLLVVEADESDGTVALYRPDIAVITNIEYDHMEHFEDERTLVDCFDRFASNARRAIVYCADDPRASSVCAGRSNARSYGFAEAASVRGSELGLTASETVFVVSLGGRALGRVCLPVAGGHNAQNALAACAAGLELGLTFEQVRGGLERFRPARRRFEVLVDGPVMVLSDYAHHPTEIRALVKTARLLGRRRLIAVFQPHRYTRTRALAADFPPAFAGLDEVALVPVYAASEDPLPGGTSEDLLERFRSDGRPRVRLLASLGEAWKYLRSVLRPGDALLVIGAGDVEQIAFWAKADCESRGSSPGQAP